MKKQFSDAAVEAAIKARDEELKRWSYGFHKDQPDCVVSRRGDDGKEISWDVSSPNEVNHIKDRRAMRAALEAAAEVE